LGAHTKSDLKVHVVWIPKYRKLVLTGDLALGVRHGAPRAIEPQGAVDAMDALMIPPIAERPQPIKQLPETRAAILGDLCRERVNLRSVAHQTVPRRSVPGRPRQSYRLAGHHHRDLVLTDQLRDRLPLRGRRHQSRCTTSFGLGALINLVRP